MARVRREQALPAAKATSPFLQMELRALKKLAPPRVKVPWVFFLPLAPEKAAQKTGLKQ